MSENYTSYVKLLNFLQGSSLALGIVVAIKLFTIFYNFGLIIALLCSFIGFLIGVSFVVIFEVAKQQIEKLKEIKKQTQLLEKLLEK